MNIETKSKVWECKKNEKGHHWGIDFEYQGCGIIEPLKGAWGEIRQSCACEQAARKLHDQREEENKLLMWRREQEKNTFRWLGGCWGNAALSQKTFATFEKERQPAAYKVVQAFAQYPGGTLILHGSYGIGKTHLLAALCNELRTRKDDPKGSLFTTSLDLFNAIQSRMSQHQSYESVIEQAIQTHLLVIDDIDKAKRSDFREEIYFSIIDKRIQAERPIAISTNRLSELENFVGGACASRLSVGLIEVEMIGKDYRRQL